MSTPGLSVIIPHYNSKEYLVRAINSVPAREDIEVVVVDNSPSPLDKAEITGVSRDFRLVYSEYGKGAGRARNVGLDTTMGRLIMFMDADDMFTAEASDIINEYLTAENISDITYFRAKSIYNDTGLPARRADLYNKHLDNCINDPSELNQDRLKYYHLTPWAKLYKREAIDRSGARFDEVPASNDLYFCTCVALNAQSVKADTRCIYIVTSSGTGTLTTTPKPANLRSRHLVILRQSNLFKSAGKIQFSSMPSVMLRSLLKSSFTDFAWGVGQIFKNKVNPLSVAWNKIKHKEYK